MVRGQRKNRGGTKGNKDGIGSGNIIQDGCNAKITSYFTHEEEIVNVEDPDRKSITATTALLILHQFSPSNINKTSPHRIEMKEMMTSGRGASRLKKDHQQQQKLTDYFPVRRSGRKTKKVVLEEIQKSLEEAVISKKEEGLEVHMFEGKGRGVVATRNFQRGEFVVEYAGELITVEEAREREVLYSSDQNTGCYMYYFKHKSANWCVDATAESDRLGRLVNHCRVGNLLTKAVTVKGRPHLVLVAKDTIEAGQELLYDYGDRSKDSLRHHPWLAN